MYPQSLLLVISGTKQKAAYANHCASFFNGCFVIAAHAHGKSLEFEVWSRELGVLNEKLFQVGKLISHFMCII